MRLLRSIAVAWTRSERLAALVAGTTLAVSLLALAAITVTAHSTFVPIQGGAYREGIVGQPSIIHPLVSGNPADQDMAALIFAPLGTLLVSSEQNDDATVYTLKLKEDLVWEDGVPLTTDDVVFTVTTAQDPNAESSFAAALRGVSAERVSQLQVKLTLPAPNVFFSDLIARLPVVPAHIWGRIPVKNYHLSEYALRPVGNGPYRIKSLTVEKDGFVSEYQLVPNERFHGTPPFISDFSVRFFESSDALLDAFRLRRINGFGYLPPFPAARDAATGASAVTVRLPRYYAVFLNAGANDLFANASFRAALSYAVDRDAIAREVFGGDAEPFMPGMTAAEAAAIASRERATSALARAKINPNASLTLTVPNLPFLVRMAEMVVENWRAVGIPPVTIEKVPLVRFRDEVLAPRAYEMVLAPHTLLHPQDLYPFWHSSSLGASGENFSLYTDRRVDALLERARSERDPAEREALVQRVEATLAEDLPAVFLVSLPYTHVHTKDLEGFSTEGFVGPQDRFLKVAEWNVSRVRVLK